VTTRAQVIELLDAGHSYETAATALCIPAGLAFMIATGVPADSGDRSPQRGLPGERVLPEGSQQLVNPPPFNPTRDKRLAAWVGERARRELRSSQ
jgi:hypothetical protein